MSTTPRTDAAKIKSGFQAVPNEFLDFARTLETELARLRALFPAICSALGNGACCTPDVSIGFLESIPNEVASVVARLRADLERFTGHGLLDCHAICDQRDAAIARAERAEAEILERAAMMRDVMLERDKAEAALAEAVDGEINGGSIFEKLLVVHIPRLPVGYRVGHPVKVILPAIDAAMKEGSK